MDVGNLNGPIDTRMHEGVCINLRACTSSISCKIRHVDMTGCRRGDMRILQCKMSIISTNIGDSSRHEVVSNSPNIVEEKLPWEFGLVRSGRCIEVTRSFCRASLRGIWRNFCGRKFQMLN